MAEGFINKFHGICGGSKVLASLIGVNIVLGVVLWVVNVILEVSHAAISLSPLWFALPSDLSLFLSHPWTLLTYMVTQFSLLHMLFNVLWLYWFGRLMLFSLGERRLLVIYVAGGLAGGIAYIVAAALGMAAGAYLCGASSAVLAIMSVVAIVMPDYELNLFIFGRVKLKWFALVCILLTLLGSGGSQAGTVAHIGGVLCGVAYGMIRKMDNVKKTGAFKNVYRKVRKKNVQAVVDAAKGRLSDHERLDQLLVKIRLSGYPSLTDRERAELDALSARMRNRKDP